MKLIESIKAAKRVYIVGNGGSYANSIHIANDLLSVGIKAYTMDVATFSAFANDYGYYRAFERWLRVVAEKDDLLIALSGSGRSPNILFAIDEAEKIGMKVERVFGAPTMQMQHAEEHQIWLGHQAMLALKK